MNELQMAAKLYDARDALKSLFPADFKAKVAEWQHVIVVVSKAKNLTEIQAMIHVLETLRGKEVAQMWVMAAYVEMIGPS